MTMINSQAKQGYKHTPLGWIPEEWGIKKIHQFAKVTAGATPSTNKAEYWGGKIPWMNSGELNKKQVFDVSGRITESGLKSSSTKLLPRNCILIGLAGQGKTRGTVAINRIELCTNQSIAAILPNGRFVEEYLFYNLENRYDELRKLSTGDGGRGGLNLRLIGGLSIFLPPLPEQKAIAKVLSTWDEAISKTQELITQKELRKKWLMQQLLTGKKRLKGFKGEWKKYTYEKLLKVVKRSFEFKDDELYKLISIRRRSGGIFFRDALYGNQIKVKDLRTANKGDFLFSKMQIVHGASALVTKEFDGAKISGSYIATIAKDSKILNMEYFNWYSKLPYFYHQTYVSSYGVHIEKMTFDFESFLQLDLLLPSVEEQTAIVNVLKASEQEIELLNQKLESLKEQKKGLMQVLLSGKKRIRIK
ncbi:MAG: restriction endonuclease subunit S [Ignavibacteriaceae bacterium]|nr:restriction endonuclease subunit S [Ignavibacteriaceae bacterium]